jgi:hypothetical protein
MRDACAAPCRKHPGTPYEVLQAEAIDLFVSGTEDIIAIHHRG